MKKTLLWIIILACIIVVGYFVSELENGSVDTDLGADEMMDDKADMDNMNNDTMNDDEIMDNDMEDSEWTTTVTTVHDGYQVYSEDGVAAALANGEKVVLFFHATWCPTCKSLDADIMANEANIPDNVSIFKVDYDSETDLKAEYDVSVQHTLVYVDENMDKVSDARGLPTLEDVVNGIN